MYHLCSWIYFPIDKFVEEDVKAILFNRGDLLGVDGLAEIQKIIYSVLILPLSNTHISGKPHSSYLLGGTCTYPGNNMSTALSICQIPSCCLTHSLDWFICFFLHVFKLGCTSECTPGTWNLGSVKVRKFPCPWGNVVNPNAPIYDPCPQGSLGKNAQHIWNGNQWIVNLQLIPRHRNWRGELVREFPALR